jgi:hypothetical protein
MLFSFPTVAFTNERHHADKFKRHFCSGHQIDNVLSLRHHNVTLKGAIIKASNTKITKTFFMRDDKKLVVIKTL